MVKNAYDHFVILFSVKMLLGVTLPFLGINVFSLVVMIIIQIQVQMSWLVQLGKTHRSTKISRTKPSLAELMQRFEKYDDFEIKLNCQAFCLVQNTQQTKENQQFNKFAAILENKRKGKENKLETINQNASSYNTRSFAHILEKPKLNKVRSDSKFQHSSPILEAEVEQSIQLNYKTGQLCRNSEDLLEGIIQSNDFNTLKYNSLNTEREAMESMNSQKKYQDIDTTPSVHQNEHSQSHQNQNIQQQSQFVTQFTHELETGEIDNSISQHQFLQHLDTSCIQKIANRQVKVTKLKCKVKQFGPLSVIRSPEKSIKKLGIHPSMITDICDKSIRKSIVNLLKDSKIKGDCSVDVKGTIIIDVCKEDPYGLLSNPKILNNISCSLAKCRTQPNLKLDRNRDRKQDQHMSKIGTQVDNTN